MPQSGWQQFSHFLLPEYFPRLTTCHMCIQRFVPYANFTYIAHKLHVGKHPGIVEMYADITDDIPFAYVQQSCISTHHICSFPMNYPDNFVSEEDKNLVNILKKSKQSSEAPRGIWLFGIDLKIATSSSLEGSGINSKTYCLLLQDGIPELWILGCLRCLAPGDKDERYLISKPNLSSHQWVLRYTTTKTQVDTMQRCGNACGTIGWGSEIECLVARLYTSTQRISLYSSNFAGYAYTTLTMTHSQPNKNACLFCVRSLIGPHVEHTRASLFVLTGADIPISEIRASCSKERAPCMKIDDKNDQIPRDLSNFKSSQYTIEESSATFSMQEWSSPYHCVHHSFTLAHRLMYGKLMHTTDVGLGQSEGIRTCWRCIMETAHPEIIAKALADYRLTSKRSALLFFSQPLDVQTFAIRCVRLCKLFTGLSKGICEYLQDIEKHSSEHNSPSDHTLQPLSEPTRTNTKTAFIKAISHLKSEPSDGFIWFLQFEIMGEGKSDGSFKNVAFCIAAVSNTYVVSTVSGYILTSRFDSTHVLRVCENVKISKIIFYEKLKMDFDSQPLSFAAIKSVLELAKTPQVSFLQR